VLSYNTGNIWYDRTKNFKATIVLIMSRGNKWVGIHRQDTSNETDWILNDVTARLRKCIAKVRVLASPCVSVRLSVCKDSRIAERDFVKSGNWEFNNFKKCWIFCLNQGQMTAIVKCSSVFLFVICGIFSVQNY